MKRAIQLSKEGLYDQVWCVFDADPKAGNPKQGNNFNAAIKLGDKQRFGIAYSNQAFEYWIILHFDDHQGGGMDRKNYSQRINQLLKPFGIKYDGNNSKIITEELFDLLDGTDKKTKTERKILAMARAKRNFAKFDGTNPARAESSTTVFRLVEELLKYV